MAIHQPFLGRDLLLGLIKALGLEGKGVQKIVLVASINEVAQVYVKGNMDANTLPAVLGVVEIAAVRDVVVADDCKVIVVPLETSV